jgi:hypothetical protein
MDFEKADLEALREVEVAWLANELGASIANLGYPVGMGQRPREEALKIAAANLFDRYATMIEMARNTAYLQGRESAAKVCDEEAAAQNAFAESDAPKSDDARSAAIYSAMRIDRLAATIRSGGG